MSFMGAYILRMTGAALICSIASMLVDKKAMNGRIMKLLCGTFLSLTMVSPFLQLEIDSIPDFIEDIQNQAENVSSQGEKTAYNEMETIIKSKIQAYILDKAMSYGGQLTVEVNVDDAGIPTPCGVRISGTISPYGKTQLQEMIRRDLGIPLEAQIWENS